MNTNIVSAGQLNPDELAISFTSRFDHSVKYYDDGYGPLWLYRDASGLLGIVRAQTWEDAYGIIEDEFLTVVPADEVHEAYGSYDKLREHLESKGHADTIELRRFACEYAPIYFRMLDAEILELAEGYSYQPNSTGTGIVSHDLNGEQLEPLTVELLNHLEIKMIVTL